MTPAPDMIAGFPRPLDSYPSVAGASLARTLADRVQAEPFNAVVTAIFVLAILHTFAAGRFGGARSPRSAPPRRGVERAWRAGPPERARRTAPFPGRGRGGSSGSGQSCCSARSPCISAGDQPSTTSTTSLTTPSRCSSSSSWLWLRAGRSSALRNRACGAWRMRPAAARRHGGSRSSPSGPSSVRSSPSRPP